ncbi:cold shock domain protein CspD [Bacteroidales bacterium Barb4]|nr:cold shock domain protein CspD [Bacteroidales bacterium Barb4]
MEKIKVKGIIKMYNGLFGFINSGFGDIYFHKSEILTEEKLDKGDEVQFFLIPSQKKEGMYQASEIVLVKKTEKTDKQTDNNLLIGIVQWYNNEKGFGVVKTSDNSEFFLHKKNALKTVILNEKDFCVFESRTQEGRLTAIRYKKFELIEDLQHVNEKTQSELLQQYLSVLGKIERDNSLNVKYVEWKYNKITAIAQSGKIDEKIKDDFLKAAYEKASVDCKYKMLFEDCLIDISKQTLEIQSELLEQYLSDYSKAAYEEASDDYKYQMLFEDYLIDIPEVQFKLLQQYLSKLGKIEHDNSWNVKDKEWKYNKIKSIVKSDKIDEKAKEGFLKAAYEKASDDYKYKMLFEDNFLDFDFIEYIKEYNLLNIIKNKYEDLYNELFGKAYPNISKIDRLYLWLNGLNSYYNYFEFVQVAWQLSNDERKLFNKRVKEYAEEERLQKFISQIPKAELLEETESSKIYKCKWRNLYYKQGAIEVFLDKTTATEDYKWEVAREEWNLLTQEYFNNRRINDIIVTIDNNYHILDIVGLDDIEVKIVFAEIHKNGTSERRTDISSSQVTKIIHNVAARNSCINFLASQNSPYNAVDVQELVTEQYRDISFLFPIPDGKGNVYLIWESAEFEKSKATHIFKIREECLQEMMENIRNFIETNYRTRSRLNSVETDDLEKKQDLQYFSRVNHDSVEYQVWEDRMKKELSFLS